LNVAVEQLPGLHGVVSNFKSVRKKGKGSPRVEWGITDFTYSTDRATVPPVFPPGGQNRPTVGRKWSFVRATVRPGVPGRARKSTEPKCGRASIQHTRQRASRLRWV